MGSDKVIIRKLTALGLTVEDLTNSDGVHFGYYGYGSSARVVALPESLTAWTLYVFRGVIKSSPQRPTATRKKKADIAYDILEGADDHQLVKIEIRPKVGYRYDLTIECDPKTGKLTGEMDRLDGDWVGPPFLVYGDDATAITHSCWAILQDGYQTLMTKSHGVHALEIEIGNEYRLERQKLMNDIERCFRKIPSNPKWKATPIPNVDAPMFSGQ